MSSKTNAGRVAGVCALAASTLTLAPVASAADSHSFLAQPRIIAGSPGSDPSIVQLNFGQNGGTYGCTGEVIASQWVLTAQHCTDTIDWMDVYVSNSTTNPGTPIAADRVANSPYGDVALVHLNKPANVAPMSLASSYTPRIGDTGTIWGYGLRANGVPTTGLFKATVNVIGSSTDAYNGQAIHVQGVNGASNHGDSGGPLIINGQIVGVCSTGDTADPGANPQATSNYANLTQSRAWIRSTAGV